MISSINQELHKIGWSWHDPLQARPVQPEEKKGPETAFLTWLRGLSEMKS